ncbi:MAG: HAD family phosphatase [Synechococcaceae cyanobacterium SM2_3_1]|nr:HAD family phosphatase [Synechococcaceae cyanobacterium SM2_3_1]
MVAESFVPPSSDIRLLVLDIDGTISGESNQITPAVLETLNRVRHQGIDVAIATGRMYRSAVRFHQEIQASMPLSTYQGALIRQPEDGQTHRHWLVDTVLAQKLLDAYADYPLAIHIYIDDQLYVKEMNPLSQAYAERSQVPAQLFSQYPDPQSFRATKILAMTEDTDLIDELTIIIQAQFPADQLYFTRSTPTFLEATHAAVNKGSAVKYLAEGMLGLTADQVMTIGDSDNDIEMLQYAGIGVAMGNAKPEIKAIADWIAPSVEEDGVVAAIEEFIL